MTAAVALDQIRLDLATAKEQAEVSRRTAEADARRVSELEQLLDLAEAIYGKGDETRAARYVEPFEIRPLADAEAIDGMVAVLSESGEPMTMPEIVQRMMELGWTTRAEKPSDTLRVAVRRDESNRIVRVARGRYKLATIAEDGDEDEDGDDVPSARPFQIIEQREVG
jgi:HB1, ASXL, restriction endonuclease HTH domain